MVVAGSVTDYESGDPSCAGRPYSAGQGFVDSGQDVHALRNEGTVPAETVATQIVPKDAARSVDMPRPDNCPNF